MRIWCRQACVRLLMAGLVLTTYAGLAAPAAQAACSTTTSTYKSTVTGTSGVISYWRFDEASGTDVCDTVGARSATLAGGYTRAASGATVDTNAATTLNGSTGHATVPSATALNPTAGITIEAWVKPAANLTQTIVSKPGQYSLKIESNRLLFTLWQPDGTTVTSSAPIQTIVAGAWQHVVATFDGGTARVYRNAVQEGDHRPGWSTMRTGTSALSIGSTGTSEFLQGGIDDVSLYNRALSLAEVRNHYTAGSGVSTTPSCPTSTSAYKSMITGTAGLISYWRFDEPSGPYTCDTVGGRTGMISGPMTRREGATADGNASLGFSVPASVVVPDALQLSPANAVTAEAWVNLGSTNYSAVINKHDQYLMRIQNGQIHFAVSLTSGAYAEVWAPVTPSFPRGTWEHVVGTFDGRTVRLYQNATVIASGSWSGTIKNGAWDLWIGRLNRYDYFGGGIDEVALYSRALSASEIRSHYEAGKGIDTVAPKARLTQTPKAATNSSSATFAFTADETGATFDCRIDNQSWAACTSPATYSGFNEGRHVFNVRAKDAAGNIESPGAEYEWRIDALGLQVPQTMHANGAELRWGSDHDSATFTGYQVHRDKSATFTPSDSTRLATILDRGVTSYRDTTAAPNTTFTYKLLMNGAAAGTQTVTLPANGSTTKNLQPDSVDGRVTDVRSVNDCENNGAAAKARVGATTHNGLTGTARTLLTFDLRDVPADASISSADLHLYAVKQPTAAMTVNAHRLTGEWQEGAHSGACAVAGATWLTAGRGIPWNAGGGDFDDVVAGTVSKPGTSSTAAWDTVNVRDVVRGWVAGGYANHGFLIKAADEAYNSARSIEYYADDNFVDPARRPKLSLSYADGSRAIGPEVSVTAPEASTTHAGTVALKADASDDRRVDKVEFLVDGSVVSTLTSAPYAYNWPSSGTATRTVTARATDDAGNVSTSKAVSFTVDNSASPTVSVTVPQTNYPNVVKADSPLGYWRFGDAAGAMSFADSSGFNRPAGWLGSYTLGQAPVIGDPYDKAILLKNAATDGGATASGFGGLMTTAMTAEAWVEYSGLTTNGTANRVLSRGWGGVGGWLLEVDRSSTGTSRAAFSINVAGTVKRIEATINRLGPLHLAGVYDGTLMRLYVNGIYSANLSIGAAVLSGNTPVVTGSSLSSDMVVDEAAVYGAVLDGTKIQNHYTTGAGARGTVTITGSASDDVALDRVELYAGDRLLKTVSAAPFSFSEAVDTLNVPLYDGDHAIVAKAYSASGQKTETAPRTLRVANAVGSKYEAKLVAASAQPTSMTYDPALGSAQETYGVDVTLTNKSQYTWAGNTVNVGWKLLTPDGTLAASGTGTPVAAAVAPQASQTVTVQVKPPALDPGVDRKDYTLRLDAYEPSTTSWFAAKGNAPLESRVTVNRKIAIGLGLERYYHYDGQELGGGMQHLINLASGNAIVRWSPWAAPGRGISTLLDLTYNSLERDINSPAGNNVSLSISSLVRFGSKLDFHPHPSDQKASQPRTGKHYVDFTDADGTTHRFDGVTDANNVVQYWVQPTGVHLHLQRHSTTDPARAWVITRPDLSKFFFDTDGWPTYVVDGNGRGLRFELEDAPPGQDPGHPKKRVRAVYDDSSRSFALTYYTHANAKQRAVGRIQRITDHDGSAIDFEYYGDGNLRRLIQRGHTPLGIDVDTVPDRTWEFTYEDPSGGAANPPASQTLLLHSVRDPLKHQTTFTYLPESAGVDRHKISSVTNRGNEVTSYSYDTPAQRTSVERPGDGAAWRLWNYAFDSEGKLASLSDPLGHYTQIEWTNRHVTKVTEPSDEPTPVTTQYAYDDNGALTKVVDQEGRETRLTYHHPPAGSQDVAGKWGPGRTMAHTSLLETKTDPAGVKSSAVGDYMWTFGWDLQKGNLQTIGEPAEGGPAITTTYTYDPVTGDITSITDPEGRKSVFGSYDPSGQPKRVEQVGATDDPDGGGNDRVTQITYGADGEIRSVQDPRHFDDTPSLTSREQFRYDSFGRLVSSSMPDTLDNPSTQAPNDARVIYANVDYDANDNVIRDYAPHDGDVKESGSLTVRDYDLMDRLVKVTGPTAGVGARVPDASRYPSKVTTLAYDSAGMLSSIRTPRGQGNADPNFGKTLFIYDEIDRLTHTYRWDEAGTRHVERRCYDKEGNVWSVTPPQGEITNDMCHQYLGNNSTAWMSYWRDHRLKSVRRFGRGQDYTYDDNGDLKTVSQPLKDPVARVVTTTHTYDQRGLLVHTEAPLDGARKAQQRYVYNKAGDVVFHVSPRAYDANPGVTDFTDKPFVPKYHYDEFGEVSRVELPTSTSHPEQHWVHYQYDQNGAVKAMSLPTVSSTMPLVNGAPDPDQATTVSYFDSGRIRSQRPAGSPATRFEYTPEGRQSSRVPLKSDGTENRARTSTWTYFPDGSLEERTGRDGQRVQYDYDANGNLEEATQLMGDLRPEAGVLETVATYDSLDRLKTVKDRRIKDGPNDPANPDWSLSKYTYDKNGNVKTQLENRIVKADAAETLVEEGRHASFDYDGGDFMQWMFEEGKTPTDTSDDRQITYDWENTGAPTLRRVRKRDTQAQVQSIQWTRLDNGLVKDQVTRDDNDAIAEEHHLNYLAGGVYANGHPIRDDFALKRAGGSGPCETLAAGCYREWTYDARERLTKDVRKRARTSTTTYDLNPAGSIIESKQDSDPSSTFNYQGLRLVDQRIGNSTKTITDDEIVTRYFHDALGNLNCVTSAEGGPSDCDYGGEGTPSAELLEWYRYDSLDRLEAQRQFGRESNKLERKSRYVYDGLDRPVIQTEHHYEAGGIVAKPSSRTTYFDYMGLSSSVAREHRAPVDAPIEQSTKVKTYTYGAQGERLGLTSGSKADPANAKQFTYGEDPNGSVSLLMGAGGKIQGSYAYTAYGQADDDPARADDDADGLTRELDPDSTTGAFTKPDDPLNAYRYSGKRLDSASGTLDMGARRYGPSIHSFMQQDALDGALDDLGLSSDPLTANRYSLAGGNPISFVELDGHVVGDGPLRSHSQGPASGGSTAGSSGGSSGGTSGGTSGGSSGGSSGSSARVFRSFSPPRFIARRLDENREAESMQGPARGTLWDMAMGEAAGFLGVEAPHILVDEHSEGYQGGKRWGEDVSYLTGIGALRNAAKREIRQELTDRAGSQARKRGDDVADGGCSFSGTTTVVMGDGSRKPIHRIQKGDFVLATDPLTGQRSVRRVSHVWVHEDRFIRLRIGREWITTTEDHPFWNATDQAWQPAEILDPGDAVATSDGRLAVVAQVVMWGPTNGRAFNLTVEGVHTYHVGSQGLLVHNIETCIPWSSARVKAAANTLRRGADQIRVASKSEAEELFLRVYQGKGYRNTSGLFPSEAKRWNGGTKRGTYHWDTDLDPNDPHGFAPHLQIHTFGDNPNEPSIIRIFYDE